MMIRRRFLGSLLASGTLLVLACAAPASPAPSASEPTGPSGTLTVGIASDIISGDFHLATGGGNWPLTTYVPQGLTGTSPATGELVPMLATEWKALENGKVWEFRLRKGVEFHNGEPFTASAVKYTFERLLDPATKAGTRPQVAPVYDSIEIVDDYTVRFTLKAPNAIIPTLFGGQAIFPPKYTQSVGAEEFAKRPIGTGPYKLVGRRPGEVIVLEGFEKFWNTDKKQGPTRSQFKEVIQRIIPEDQTRIAALQTKEVGLIVNVPTASVKRLESSPNLKVQYVSSDQPIALLINSMAEADPKTGQPNPFRDKRVRQAVNYAVDVDNIAKKLLTGKERRSTGLGYASLGFDASIKPYSYDPPKAKELLAQAGYGNGFTTAIFDPTGRWPGSKEVSEAIGGYLGAVGIKASVQPAEYAVVAQNLLEKKLYGLSFWGQSGGPEPVTMLTFFYRSGPKAVRGVYQGSPEMDTLLDQALAEVDAEKRAALIKRMHRMYIDDAADLFLFFNVFAFAHDTTLVRWENTEFETTTGAAPYWALSPAR